MLLLRSNVSSFLGKGRYVWFWDQGSTMRVFKYPFFEPEGSLDVGFHVKYIPLRLLKFLKFRSTSFCLQSQDMCHRETLTRVIGARHPMIEAARALEGTLYGELRANRPTIGT